MLDIRFYDYELNLLYILPNVISSNWRVYYNDSGSWELHFDRNDKSFTQFILEHDHLIAVQGNLQADVTGKQFLNEGIIYGSTLNNFLAKNVLLPFRETCSPETLVRNKVQESVGSFITLGLSINTGEEREFWRKVAHSTLDIVKDCLELYNMGHRIRADLEKKIFVFDILSGVHNPIILSESNRNVYSEEYLFDKSTYNTAVWYCRYFDDKGQWDPTENKPKLVNNIPENIGLRYQVSASSNYAIVLGYIWNEGDYIYCDNDEGTWKKSNSSMDDDFWYYLVKNSDAEGIYKHIAILETGDAKQALETLSKRDITSRTKIMTKNIKWGNDYELGDIVRFNSALTDKTIKKKVIGVEIWFEGDEVGERPILEEFKEEE